jgi:hypothetical protein
LIVFVNKTDQSAGTGPTHQTVAPKIQFKSANKSIQIEFTDQKLSPACRDGNFLVLFARKRLDRFIGKLPAASAAQI